MDSNGHFSDPEIIGRIDEERYTQIANVLHGLVVFAGHDDITVVSAGHVDELTQPFECATRGQGNTAGDPARVLRLLEPVASVRSIDMLAKAFRLGIPKSLASGVAQ